MAATLFEDAYQDASVRFTVTLDDRGFFRVTFTGQGTVEGTHAFVSMMDRCVKLVRERGQKLTGLVDLVGIDGAPLRAQAILTRWILGVRDDLGKFAIAGGSRGVRRLAKAIVAAARADNVRFTETADEALRWLEG